MKGISSISYLQAKIIETIYLSVIDRKDVKIDDIASATHYKKNSKILHNAIDAVIKKGYVNGNFKKGFSIPKNSEKLLKIIEKNNLKSDEKYRSLLDIENLQIDLIDDIDLRDLLIQMDGWYSYVEEFSSDLILKKIDDQNLKKDSIIYDPFIGSGTTAIAANLKGFNAIGIDANPLMIEVSNVKTNWKLDPEKIFLNFKKLNEEFIRRISKNTNQKSFNSYFSNMPPKELDQWLSIRNQKEISTLKEIILEISNKEMRRFFLICMSKSAFDTSYVALCPGTTFYPFRNKNLFWEDFGKKVFSKIQQLRRIKKSLNPGKSNFINDNCINVLEHVKKNSIDFAITSPPYPNDLEYTRQTRLELYLLDLVSSMEDVTEIKKNMVKSSTKLIYKESDSAQYIENNKKIKKLTSEISKKLEGRNWGWDYPRMVREYFGDMYLCMKETKKVLKKNSKFMLVCGDQTIQGVFLPVCDILIEMGKELGYKKSYKEPYRIRRSTTHNLPLPEDIVILEK